MGLAHDAILQSLGLTETGECLQVMQAGGAGEFGLPSVHVAVLWSQVGSLVHAHLSISSAWGGTSKQHTTEGVCANQRQKKASMGGGIAQPWMDRVRGQGADMVAVNTFQH